jgi:hypothetical protein
MPTTRALRCNSLQRSAPIRSESNVSAGGVAPLVHIGRTGFGGFVCSKPLVSDRSENRASEAKTSVFGAGRWLWASDQSQNHSTMAQREIRIRGRRKTGRRVLECVDPCGKEKFSGQRACEWLRRPSGAFVPDAIQTPDALEVLDAQDTPDVFGVPGVVEATDALHARPRECSGYRDAARAAGRSSQRFAPREGGRAQPGQRSARCVVVRVAELAGLPQRRWAAGGVGCQRYDQLPTSDGCLAATRRRRGRSC